MSLPRNACPFRYGPGGPFCRQHGGPIQDPSAEAATEAEALAADRPRHERGEGDRGPMSELWENDDPAQMRENIRRLVEEITILRGARENDKKAVEALGSLIKWIDDFVPGLWLNLHVNDFVSFEQRCALARARGETTVIYNGTPTKVP